MNAGVWRGFALTCIALAVAFVLYQSTLPARDDFGVTFRVPRENPGTIVVTAVSPGSSAQNGGIRTGDRLSFGNSTIERARVVYATPGSRVDVLVNGRRHVTLTARNAERTIPWGGIATRLAFLLIAALLAWRRPGDRATRSLVVFLVCYGLAISMDNGVLASPLLTLI
ncbi:MAG: PDZ domain-containing protein, partial [Candidatus Eremiobacteraeota bacterium]|nr:PDZ domain-containing protein [Candidatus Eremiobacteraeota bacterium]